MTTARSIVCGSCGSDVPYGRLSCPACGDLLASVAGGRRPSSGGEGLFEMGAATSATAATSAPAATPAVAAAAGGERITPSVLHDAAEPAPMATLAFDDDPLEADPADPPAAYIPPPIIDGGPPPAAAVIPPPPGAYVPPIGGGAGGAAVAAYAMPGGPAAPARAWAGHGAAADLDSDTRDGATASASPASTVAGIDGARLAEFVGWLAIAGGALAAVGFLLPWGPSMIGATGVGFLDRWGLAGPFHLIVALAVVAVVVLAIVPNRVPTWIRIGLAGTILGVFLLGLVWPYVFGFSSTGPGALAVAIGAAALAVAGVTCLVTDRHAPGAPPV